GAPRHRVARGAVRGGGGPGERNGGEQQPRGVPDRNGMYVRHTRSSSCESVIDRLVRCWRPRPARGYSAGNNPAARGVLSRRPTRHLEGRLESSELARFEAVVLEFDEAQHSGAVADEHPEAALLRSAAKESLGRALDRLAPEFREVIVLRELEGLSYKEISDVAGVPVGTVMSRLSRARTR